MYKFGHVQIDNFILYCLNYPVPINYWGVMDGYFEFLDISKDYNTIDGFREDFFTRDEIDYLEYWF